MILLISKNIKKLLVAGVAIIMATSVGTNLNNVNAKRRGHYHHIRIARVYHHHNRMSKHEWRVYKHLKYLINRKHKRISKYHTYNRVLYTNYSLTHHSHKYNRRLLHHSNYISWYLDCLRPRNRHAANIEKREFLARTFQDINNDRVQHHRHTLVHNRTLDRLANIRAKQIQTNFAHHDPQGNYYIDDDAAKAGMNTRETQYVSENISSASLGNARQGNDPTKYFNRNGRDMADEDENTMMNHDAAEDNGHRINILDNTSHSVGLGVSYNPTKGHFYLAEEFE